MKILGGILRLFSWALAKSVPQEPAQMQLIDQEQYLEAVGYMLRLKERIKSLQVQEGFAQTVHQDSMPLVEPALVNATYEYMGRTLVSVAFPEITPIQNYGNVPVNFGTEEIHPDAIDKCLRIIMAANNIGIPEKATAKFGSCGHEFTHYVEIDIAKDGFRKASKIIDNLLSCPVGTSAEDAVARISSEEHFWPEYKAAVAQTWDCIDIVAEEFSRHGAYENREKFEEMLANRHFMPYDKFKKLAEVLKPHYEAIIKARAEQAATGPQVESAAEKGFAEKFGDRGWPHLR
jgi:hypothetical protein